MGESERERDREREGEGGRCKRLVPDCPDVG